MKRENSRPGLKRWVLFSLFATSYTPLFILVMFKQMIQNYSKFDWNKTGYEFANNYVTQFGLSIILGLVVVAGIFGIIISLNNLKSRAASNSNQVHIVEATNKNSEAISYIGTYILPFLFSEYSSWYEFIAILFLLFIVYRIYVNSTLILINPLLNIWYGLFEIKFKGNPAGDVKTGMVITKNHDLDDGDDIGLYPIGKKLFIGVMNETR